VPNLGIILIFAVSVAATPSPAPTSAPADVCGSPRSNLLAALNRPSIGFSACAAKPGDRIAELGYQNSAGNPALAQFPQGFLRFGTASNLEFDFIGPAFASEQLAGIRSNGAYDSGIGAKYELWHDGSRAFAADFLYTAPTGTASFTAGAPVETVNVDYTLPISSLFSVASTLGMQSDYAAAQSGRSARFFAALPSIAVTDQWNRRAQAFIETFAQTRTRPDGGALFGVDAAFQYLLLPDLEVDVETGRTVTDATRQHYVGFGFGVRF
jgi:hypothetical protein